jgi:hypothetical protein
MRRPSIETITRWSAVLALAGLGMVGLSLLVPKPIPVVAAMTFGQVLGTASFVLFVSALLLDTLRRR